MLTLFLHGDNCGYQEQQEGREVEKEHTIDDRGGRNLHEFGPNLVKFGENTQKLTKHLIMKLGRVS